MEKKSSPAESHWSFWLLRTLKCFLSKFHKQINSVLCSFKLPACLPLLCPDTPILNYLQNLSYEPWSCCTEPALIWLNSPDVAMSLVCLSRALEGAVCTPICFSSPTHLNVDFSEPQAKIWWEKCGFAWGLFWLLWLGLICSSWDLTATPQSYCV